MRFNFKSSLNNLAQIEGLKDETLQVSLIRLARRAMLGVPFQILLYVVTVLRVPAFREDPVVLAAFVCILANGIVRYSLVKYGPRILARPKGLRLYRAIFAGSVLTICFIWTLTALYLFHLYGPTGDAVVVLIASYGTAATTIVVSFEIVLTFVTLLVMTSGTIAALLTEPSIVNGAMISFLAGIYCLYLFVISVSFNRTQRQALKNFDELNDKDLALQAVHEEARRKHQLVETMLESINQAFLVFDRAGECIGAPSKRSIEILGLDPSHRMIVDVMRVKSDELDTMTNWYRLLFSDRLAFDDIVAHGPSSIEVPETKRVLKTHFSPMRNAQGTLEGVIFTATDVTHEIAAQRKIELGHQRAEMILRISENKALFRPFLGNVERTFQKMVGWREDMAENFILLHRELHTHKGAASLFGAAELAEMIFATELEFRQSRGADLVNLVQGEGRRLLPAYLAWKAREFNLFTQLGVFDEDMVEISLNKLAAVKDEFSEDAASSAISEKVIARILSSELGELLGNFAGHAKSTAEKLEKQISFEVTPAVPPIHLPMGGYRDVLRTFIHLINNSIDHGIEMPDERLAQGKPAVGKIMISYERLNENGKAWLRVQIRDDGRGINIAKIKSSLESMGKRVPEGASDLEVARHIFDNGLSTAEDVSAISGQGIGMGAVRAAVMKVRGTISVSRTDHEGTTFEIKLPDLTFSA